MQREWRVVMSGDASTEAESAFPSGQVSLALAGESLGNYAVVISKNS